MDKQSKSATAVEGAGGNTCTTICNEAQGAAEIACNALPWPASTICKIAAEKAGDLLPEQVLT
jgi:hypothetical protein